MGRKRSVNWAKKALEFHRQQRRKRLKSKHGLQCPKCFHLTMFIKDHGRILLIGCSNCQLGDTVPKPHGVLTLTDVYNIVCDNWRDPSIVPVWTFPKLSLREYAYLFEHVTLGTMSIGYIYRKKDEERGDEQDDPEKEASIQ